MGSDQQPGSPASAPHAVDSGRIAVAPAATDGMAEILMASVQEA